MLSARELPAKRYVNCLLKVKYFQELKGQGVGPRGHHELARASDRIRPKMPLPDLDDLTAAKVLSQGLGYGHFRSRSNF